MQEATLLRDDDSQNTYRKIDTLKQHLLILSTALFGTLILLFIVVHFFPLSTKLDPFTLKTLGFAAIFGLLGACMSAILSMGRREKKATIPEQLTQSAVVFARPLFGAAAALALYLFVQSGLFKTTLLNVNPDSTALVLGLSFIAGFSERLIISVVDTATPKNSDPAPQSSGDTEH